MSLMAGQCRSNAERTTITNAAVLGSAGLLVLGYTAMAAYFGLPGLPCLFRAAFSLPCPGCGMTRSLACLWHADVLGSLRYHPLGLAAFAAIIIATIVSWTYVVVPSQRQRIETLVRRLRDPRMGWAALSALLLVWVVRLLDAFAGWRLFAW